MHFFQGCREYFQNISFPLLQMELRPHAYYNELQQSYGRCFFSETNISNRFLVLKIMMIVWESIQNRPEILTVSLTTTIQYEMANVFT